MQLLWFYDVVGFRDIFLTDPILIRALRFNSSDARNETDYSDLYGQYYAC